MLHPQEILEHSFDKTFGVGYRVDDVHAFQQSMAQTVEELLAQKAELQKKLEILADKLTEYREDEESLRTALLGAQKLGDSVIRESKTKGEIILRDATIKAEAMLDHAKRQIEREQETLTRTQREVAVFKNRLFDLYKQHLELISAMPGEIRSDAQKPAAEPPAAEPAGEVAPAPSAEPAEEAMPTAPTAPIEAPAPAPMPEIAEDFDEIDEDLQSPFDVEPQPKSRFGALQFGSGFTIEREKK